MTSFRKQGKHLKRPILIRIISRFRQSPDVLPDQGIYLYAWRYYLWHYRPDRKSPGAPACLVLLLGGIGLLGYCIWQFWLSWHQTNIMGVGLIGMLLVTLLLVVFYAWNRLKYYMMKACRFADAAILNTDSCAEVPDYFAFQYPELSAHR